MQYADQRHFDKERLKLFIQMFFQKSGCHKGFSYNLASRFIGMTAVCGLGRIARRAEHCGKIKEIVAVGFSKSFELAGKLAPY